MHWKGSNYIYKRTLTRALKISTYIYLRSVESCLNVLLITCILFPHAYSRPYVYSHPMYVYPSQFVHVRACISVVHILHTCVFITVTHTCLHCVQYRHTHTYVYAMVQSQQYECILATNTFLLHTHTYNTYVQLQPCWQAYSSTNVTYESYRLNNVKQPHSFGHKYDTVALILTFIWYIQKFILIHLVPVTHLNTITKATPILRIDGSLVNSNIHGCLLQ